MNSENTEFSTLGEVGKFIRGITFKPDDMVPVGTADSAICMRTKNVQKNLDETDLIAVPSKFVKRKEQFLKEGDILVSTANSWDLVGKCSWIPRLDYKATAGGFISIFRADEKVVDPRYLYHWMNSSEIQLKLRYCGRQTTNISNMSYELAEKISIPLPPLPEQRRIAAILDKADVIRRKRQRAIELTEDFLRSAFLEIFGDPVTNSKGWRKRQISELLAPKNNAIRTGPFGSQLKHSEFVEEGVPVLGIDNIVTNEFKWTESRCLPMEKYRKFERYRVYPDDVVVTIMGTTGRVAVTPLDLPECMSTKHLCVISLNKEIIDPVFLWASLLFDEAVRNQAKAAGGGAIMEGWNMSIIKSLNVRIPSLSLQHKFRRLVDKKRENQRSNYSFLEESRHLFDSLTYRAFQGELITEAAEEVLRKAATG